MSRTESVGIELKNWVGLQQKIGFGQGSRRPLVHYCSLFEVHKARTGTKHGLEGGAVGDIQWPAYAVRGFEGFNFLRRGGGEDGKPNT